MRHRFLNVESIPVIGFPFPSLFQFSINSEIVVERDHGITFPDALLSELAIKVRWLVTDFIKAITYCISEGPVQPLPIILFKGRKGRSGFRPFKIRDYFFEV